MRKFFPVLFLASLFSCQNPASSSLGEVNITFTATEEVQDELLKGWLLLHSFEYEDARTAFQAVREQDPAAPMAYWGEAMSHHYTLWDREETEEARAVLEVWKEFEAENDLSISEIESALMEAAFVLYGDGNQRERNAAYAAFMEKQAEKFPANHEIGSIYALSLLGSVPEERDYEVYAQAAAIANQILAENPEHPGALHYLIHAYDDPDHAHLALEAANSYAKVAPDAAHALHMPSHIFVARGMWDEVVSSNFASYYASVDRMERKEMNNNARSYHAFAWLMYGLLHQDRFEEVEAILSDMAQYCEENPSLPARAYRIGMISTWLAFTKDPESEHIHTNIKAEDLSTSLMAIQQFTKGYQAYLQNQPDSIKQAIQAIEKARIVGLNSVSEGTGTSCSIPTSPSNPTLLDIRVAEVMELELKALHASLEGNAKEAESFFAQAIETESRTDFEYGPPTIVKPAHELYADWLFSLERYEEAIAEYDLAEARTPNRRLITDPRREAMKQLGQDLPEGSEPFQLDEDAIRYVSR